MNKIIANIQCLSSKAHEYHLNVKGEHFYNLHAEFGKDYSFLDGIFDSVSEKAQYLGQKAQSLSQILSNSDISVESKEDCYEMAQDIKENYMVLSQSITDGIKGKDEGTKNLLVGILDQIEQRIWMYSAFLAKDEELEDNEEEDMEEENDDISPSKPIYKGLLRK